MTTNPTTIVAMTYADPQGWIVPPQERLQKVSMFALKQASQCTLDIPEQQENKSSQEENDSAYIDVLNFLPLGALLAVKLMEHWRMIEYHI